MLGLGIAHLLSSVIRLIANRKRIVPYWPSVLWVINLLLIMLLVWWTDFSLTTHTKGWTFAIYALTIMVPALLYVISGLLLPPGVDDIKQAYDENRTWFFSLLTIGILSTFLQTFLLDGHIVMDADSWLKLLIAFIAMLPIVFRQDAVQKAVAVANLAWTLIYIFILFRTLPTG